MSMTPNATPNEFLDFKKNSKTFPSSNQFWECFGHRMSRQTLSGVKYKRLYRRGINRCCWCGAKIQ